MAYCPPRSQAAAPEADSSRTPVGPLDGNKTMAAEVLGLGRRTLYRKLERWGAAHEADSD